MSGRPTWWTVVLFMAIAACWLAWTLRELRYWEPSYIECAVGFAFFTLMALLPWFRQRRIQKYLRRPNDGRGGSITTDNVTQLKDWFGRRPK